MICNLQLLRCNAVVTTVSDLPEATTALHLAAKGAGKGFLCVDALLRHGANPFLEDGFRELLFVSCDHLTILTLATIYVGTILLCSMAMYL